MDVEIRDNTAALRGLVPGIEEIDAIERVSLPIPANMRLELPAVFPSPWRVLGIAASFLLLLLCTNHLFGQADQGAITGLVTDKTGPS